MYLHYLRKKKDKEKDKDKAKLIYKELINVIKCLNSNNNFKIINDFNSCFEITSILLFCIFFASKNKNINDNLIINQELINIFIQDIDHNMNLNGIGDMKIGKYVKSYVKKFYYRISQYETIFNKQDIDNFDKIIHKFDILYKSNLNLKFSNFLYNNVNILIKRVENEKISASLFSGLFI